MGEDTLHLDSGPHLRTDRASLWRKVGVVDHHRICGFRVPHSRHVYLLQGHKPALLASRGRGQNGGNQLSHGLVDTAEKSRCMSVTLSAESGYHSHFDSTFLFSLHADFCENTFETREYVIYAIRFRGRVKQFFSAPLVKLCVYASRPWDHLKAGYGAWAFEVTAYHGW